MSYYMKYIFIWSLYKRCLKLGLEIWDKDNDSKQKDLRRDCLFKEEADHMTRKMAALEAGHSLPSSNSQKENGNFSLRVTEIEFFHQKSKIK